MFGNEDKYSDAALMRAVRKRLLGEIGTRGSGGSTQKVENNIYGGGGLMGHMGGGQGMVPPSGGGGAHDPLQYMVDIERENTPTGWKKRVKRYTQDNNSPIEDVKKK